MSEESKNVETALGGAGRSSVSENGVRKQMGELTGESSEAGPVIEIEEADDARVAMYADLRHRAILPGSSRFIAEGRLVVSRLLESDLEVDSVLVERGREDEFRRIAPAEVPVYSLAKARIRELVGFDFHRGVIACGRRPAIRPLEEFSVSAGTSPVSLAAVGVTEAANLGSMLRTAAGFGIRRILLGPGTHDPFARRVIRTSMAAVFELDFYRLDHPAEQLQDLAGRLDARTVATTLAKDAFPIDRFVPDRRHAIVVMGNEARGLPLEVQAAATDRVTIPMRLGTDSLNVSIAAAIFLYELTRDRG